GNDRRASGHLQSLMADLSMMKSVFINPARRRVRYVCASTILAMMLPAHSAQAEKRDSPSKPLTLIVPFAAGGPTDVLARVIAEGMSSNLGQPIVVENTPGAGGTVGNARAARSAGD